MPLGFQVQVNDEAPLRAGDDKINVLTAIISYAASRQEIELTIGGLIADVSSPKQHAEWLRRALKVGDRILLTIVDSVEVDSPVRRTQEDPAFAEQQERRYYELLKARFERE